MTETADDILAAATAKHDQIRERTSLTPAARRTQHAKVHAAAKTQLDELAAHDAEAAKTATLKASRAAFGTEDLIRNGAEPASVAISSRDALDRVSGIKDPNEAQAVLDRADVQGDEILARAVAQHAHQMGGNFEPVLQSFANSRPNAARAINTLREAANTPQLAALFKYFTPPPPELDGLGDYEIGLLADKPVSA